jgi:hypothetical protein
MGTRPKTIVANGMNRRSMRALIDQCHVATFHFLKGPVLSRLPQDQLFVSLELKKN